MTRPETPEDDRLEAAFVAARAEARRAPPPALMARIEADAARLRTRDAPAARAKPAPLVARIRAGLAALGGWPALGGFATAGLVGLWLGYAPPAAVQDLGGWLGAANDAALFLPDDYFTDSLEG